MNHRLILAPLIIVGAFALPRWWMTAMQVFFGIIYFLLGIANWWMDREDEKSKSHLTNPPE